MRPDARILHKLFNFGKEVFAHNARIYTLSRAKQYTL